MFISLKGDKNTISLCHWQMLTDCITVLKVSTRCAVDVCLQTLMLLFKILRSENQLFDK